MLSTLILALCIMQGFARPESKALYDIEREEDRQDKLMHSAAYSKQSIEYSVKYDPQEKTAKFWNNQAQQSLKEKLATQPITGVAKNVILFMGDGMSIPTLAAARAYLGQANGKAGEETKLSFETFPYVGLSKTYCVDKQVADSACSGTAYLCGVKANIGTLGVTADVELRDCKAMRNTTNHVFSIGRLSQLKGKRTGVVTTTRVTDASPAAVYSHTAYRGWEADSDVLYDGFDPKECQDIADQMIHGITGQNLNVILGGGRSGFIPNNQKDEEGYKGIRRDERNLIEEWKVQKEGSTAEYIWNRPQLLNLSSKTDNLLGLFEPDHTAYNIERDPINKPSLSEMTQTAIKLLSRGDNGYFLFIEEGFIDHGHHYTKAHIALNETVELHKAVQAAIDLTNRADTLIIVTSDHAHTMSVSGYPDRGNDILGVAEIGSDELPYTTLSYANGPGYKPEKEGKRHNVSEDNLTNPHYEYPALVPVGSETHGGDDVGIFAWGPWAHLFTGVNEQNVIPHIIAYASCVGEGVTACDQNNLRV